jgi:anti-sigma B factor antagonist
LSVTLTSRVSGDVNILDVAGTVTMGQGSNALRHALNDAISRNQKKILLNLAGLVFLDSSGMREMLAAFNALAKDGGRLKLLSPTQRIRDLFRITRLDSVLEIHDDEAAAVRSFT